MRRAKRKRAVGQSMPGDNKANKKVKDRLSFVASGDEKQTSLHKFFSSAEDVHVQATADRGGIRGTISTGSASSSLPSSPRRGKSRQSHSTNFSEIDSAENGQKSGASRGEAKGTWFDEKATKTKSQQGAAKSQTNDRDQAALSSDSGKPGGSKVKSEDLKNVHSISDSESDTSSADTQPQTPRKSRTSWLGGIRSSPKRQPARASSPSAWSARDTEAYRNRYPNKKDDKNLKDNWEFYSNKIPSKPRGTYIDVMHEHWFGDYSLLEEHHGYIQWLFPIREKGMNWQSQELQLHEAERICKDKKCCERVIKSYELMLDFWGMRLKDRRSGEIGRADNWKERFQNLNRSSHNYLRITRMLKSLGELGHEHLKFPFLKFVLGEAVVEKTLANAQRSCLHYWVHTLRINAERSAMQDFADTLLTKKSGKH
ncbi:opioid growth factor receptor-like protein 1 [Acanthaster planci]|uniref:Opioid growth factor receptor-like protein 1 n=1 Tax=Acanthaster planci TaxID=133434 RepID=A0A8B7YVG7_ACAPL|nr:opioid growth factor receptor-like protein 1 [Acanthaster planci]XP_022096475.1 opioid growth factor receptor-like protein 1 [Acanthaster planci]